LADHSAESRMLVVSRERSALHTLWAIGEANCWQMETATSGWEALDRVQSGTSPDVVLLDLARGDADGLHTLRWLRRVRPDLPVLVLSHADDADQRLEAIRLGAQDYLVRPLDEQQVETAIKGCLKAVGDNPESETGTDDIEPIGEDMFFVAASPTMRKLRAQAELLAQVNAPLLIVGESGSGKQLAARLIHKLSVRSGFRFIKLNCAALPADLLESELFGHEGALTGNGRTKPSKFELCEKGTLFLDKITEMSLGLQAKLLHVMQEGYFVRLGGESRVAMDVRILASTDVNIEQAIADRKLREDLYYRLSAFTVHVPALRQRRDEIPLLLGHFMNQLAKRYGLPPRSFSPAVLEACQAYNWPGNLREVEQFVKRYLVAGDEGSTSGTPGRSDDSLHLAHSREDGDEPAIEHTEVEQSTSGLKLLVQNVKGEAERNAISTALEQTRWNRKAAARLLKVSYRTLLYKIQQYHMSPPEYLSAPVTGNGLRGNGHER
jgi:two-component system response regulator AtoC